MNSQPKGRWKNHGRKTPDKSCQTLRMLINRSGGLCEICGEPINLIDNDPRQATVDHIVPQSKGGGVGFNNLQLACRCCNIEKSDSVLGDA